METFINPKKMIEDDSFSEKRRRTLGKLHISAIDPQIRDIIKGIEAVPYCYTVQSCHGHIIVESPDRSQVKRIDPESALPDNGLYQIAYLALVLENSESGRSLYQSMVDISLLDNDFIQFGSAEWFWKNQGFCNSYVIQVAPYRFRHLDRFNMSGAEAQKWLNSRELFLNEVKKRFGFVCE